MSTALAALSASTALTFGLTARNIALAENRKERLIWASAWVITATAFALSAHRDQARWAGVAVLLTACIATGGRPALIMDKVLPVKTQKHDRLKRRGFIGQLAVIVVIIVVATWQTLLE